MEGVFSETVSAKEGGSVTLSPPFSEIKKDDVIDWRFGGALIARVRTNNNPSVYEGALYEKFSGRLQLNPQTGDLTITNITTTDTGDYEVSNSINTIKKTISVTVSSGQSPGETAGIAFGVGFVVVAVVAAVGVAVVVAGVIYYMRTSQV